MKIIKWITYTAAQGRGENELGGLGGFFKDGMRWEDYKKVWKKPAHKLLEELRRSIIENDIKCTGDSHQHGSAAVPLWSNGKVDTYTMRAWGDLMAAVWSTEDNQDYSYMSFYM